MESATIVYGIYNVLRDYQLRRLRTLTYLLFLKLADEQSKTTYLTNRSTIPFWFRLGKSTSRKVVLHLR